LLWLYHTVEYLINLSLGIIFISIFIVIFSFFLNKFGQFMNYCVLLFQLEMQLPNLFLNIIHESALLLILLLLFLIGGTLSLFIDQDIILIDMVYFLLQHFFGFAYDSVFSFEQVHLGHVLLDV